MTARQETSNQRLAPVVTALDPGPEGPQPHQLMDDCRSWEAQSSVLDPDPDTELGWLLAARRMARDHLAATADRPVTPTSDDYAASQPMPAEARPVDAVLAELAARLRGGVATTSGRYLGYVPAGGLPAAAVADYVAAAVNPYAALASVSPGAAAVEAEVVDWLCGVVGLPPGSGGVLTSGGSTAVLAAVVAARDAHAVLAGDPRDAVVYATGQAHASLRRALHVAGCGHAVLREVPVDDRHRMCPRALAAAVREDVAAGRRPWLLAATAGTTNTGAVDPLDELGRVARAHRLWFHVDGAYGGLFALSPSARPRLAGLSGADSVVLDPHKALFLPYGVGALVVADRRRLTDAFALSADYLPAGSEPSPADLGPELTRPFRALRVWLALHLAGQDAFAAALTEKAALARYAHRRLAAVPWLQTGPEPELSLFPVRVRDEFGGDRATAQLVERLGAGRTAFLSTTRLGGRLWARVAVLSFRTHLEHVADLCDAIDRAAPAPAGGHPDPAGGDPWPRPSR